MSIINGTAKADALSGTTLAETLFGLGGNDTLRALGGNDTLDGGTGIDNLYGGLGNDTYIVDQAADRVFERVGEGIDTVRATISYRLSANIENLLLTGTGAINGTANGLANTLTGNAAANTLSGLAGNDTIYGGAGNDVLIGGKGADVLTGGPGNDLFQFFDGDFSSRTGTGADRIVDFSPGDHIDLRNVDALVAASEAFTYGKQDFHFIGHNPLHRWTGAEVRWEVSGGNTYIYGSINGDAVADFAIRLDGVHTLTASDFLF
ncbi:MAG: M10 family metallopeptidase C-terminal domain-containing protein [Novosphingobium sp.]